MLFDRAASLCCPRRMGSGGSEASCAAARGGACAAGARAGLLSSFAHEVVHVCWVNELAITC